MHRMKNMSSMGLLWLRQWSSQIRKRHVIHSNLAQNGLLFRETLRSHTSADEDYVLLTGERLRTFQWNVVAYFWTVCPEDEGELTSQQGETSQMTWIFINTAVRISQPLSRNVGKKYQSTLRNIPKWAQSSFTPRSHNCGSVTYSALSMPRECTDRLVGCFLCGGVHTYAGHFTYKKIIPQQEIGWNLSHDEAVCDENSQLTEGWILSVWLVNILTAMNRTLQCASSFQILCCVCS